MNAKKEQLPGPPFKIGDTVRLVNIAQTNAEDENWAELAGLEEGKDYVVTKYDIDSCYDGGAICLKGYKFWHPAIKFGLVTEYHSDLLLSLFNLVNAVSGGSQEDIKIALADAKQTIKNATNV